MHFINARCAACNGITNVTVWKTSVDFGCINKNTNGSNWNYLSVYELIIKDICSYFLIAPSGQVDRFCDRYIKKQCTANCANKELIEACLYNGTQHVRINNKVFANKYCALCASDSDTSKPMVCHSEEYKIPPSSELPSYRMLFRYNPDAEARLSPIGEACISCFEY